MLDFSAQNLMQWSRMGMRKAYGVILNELANDHPELISIAADVADSANLIALKQRHPKQHYNAGISEQNMIAMAAGLAKEGSNVFVTSFAPFVSLRVYEAIRTLVCYMDLNVKLVALSSGFSLGVQGATHYALVDLAIMRAIPNLLLLSPADTTEMAKALVFLAEYKGPAYLRLTGLPGSACVYKTDYAFDVASNDVLRDGTDMIIFATGTLVNESIRAARLLQKQGISAGVVNLSTIHPVHASKLVQMCMKYKLIFTVEEHNIIGGIGSLLAEALSELPNHSRLVRLGTKDSNQVAGNYSFMMEKNGLTAKAIAERVAEEYSAQQ